MLQFEELRKGTILYHQRYKNTFRNNGDKPYHIFNYFLFEPYYSNNLKQININTYIYKISNNIQKLLA